MDPQSLPGEFSSAFRGLALGIGFVRNRAYAAPLANAVCTFSGSSATTGSIGGHELGGKVTPRFGVGSYSPPQWTRRRTEDTVPSPRVSARGCRVKLGALLAERRNRLRFTGSYARAA